GAHFDVWAQRMKPDGTPRWDVDGVRLTNAPGQQTLPIVVADGKAGAIVGWTDSRVSRPDIYAQHVDSAGVVDWTPADGVAVCASDSSQFLEAAVSDGFGGALFGWDDDRAGFKEIFAQNVGPNGVTRWIAGGVKVATGSGFRTLTTASSDGWRGALFAWQDFRGGPTCDVYAFRVTSVGTAVEPEAAPRVAARIYPARPNPLNPSTVLEFSLDQPAAVSFALYDVHGRPVRVLTEGLLEAGRHTYRWDGLDEQGRACGSGVYFARLSLPSGSRSTSITVLR
ncbi:MAG TPA: FlgD immunoglobulin-like domain containing protein, partial [Candidatus Eisenbacteria bacterium]|nr:FlgD immunoglobulin-like domain containing protein [Candidatus Eisenbacteria bacterium]